MYVTTIPETWLSVPEAAEALGVIQRDVRNMLADRRILAVRRREVAALATSSLTLVDEGGKATALPPFRGMLTALSSAGCSGEEAWQWLTAASGEPGECPIDALRAGHVHAVHRVAATFAF